jgi:hypothetical protein
VRISALSAVAGLAAVCALAIGAAPASARLGHDPCGENKRPHINPHGIHCGGVFEIPGHRTWWMPHEDRAPGCHYNTEEIVGFHGLNVGDWDYWTLHSSWVLWNGGWHSAQGAHFQVINVFPSFHNWGPAPWPVRVFFRCAHRY